MLCAVTWIPTSGSTEDRDKRTLKLFLPVIQRAAVGVRARVRW